MANYSSVLRDRLSQIDGMGQDATTWEQLKAARAKKSAQSLAQIAEVNQQTNMYNERLKNLKSLYGGETISPRRATDDEIAALYLPRPKKKTRKPSR